MTRLRLGLGPLQLSPVRPPRKAANRAPVVANAIPDQSASEGSAFSFQFAVNAFSDPDGDALTYAASLVGGGALPAWLTFTPATRTFSGTPGAGDFSDLNIRVTATDPGGLSAHDDFGLAVNGKPVVANAISNQNATATLAYSLQFASNTFTDPDGDTLTYSAALSSGSALPSWLTFTPATRTFSGTPAQSDGGTITVRVTATDPGGLSAHDDFDLAVAALSTSGLVAEWRFNSGSGQTLVDYSGNGHHGQLGSTAGADANDPAWNSLGLSFDGVNDYVVAPIATAIVTGTLTCLVRPDRTLNGTKISQAMSINDREGLCLGLDHTNSSFKEAATINTTQGGAAWVTAKYASLSQSSWYCLTVVNTGSNLIAWRNGSKITTTPYTGAAATTGTSINFGAGYSLTNNAQCTIAYAVARTGILTDAEVLREYAYIKAQVSARGIVLP